MFWQHHQDSYRSICERFGVARSTAWVSVKRVVRALYSLRNVFIRWPTYGEAQTIWTNMQTLYGFPKILGVIDGTHINIARPKRDANSYINRKGRFSIQLQVSKKNIFLVYYSYPNLRYKYYKLYKCKLNKQHLEAAKCLLIKIFFF